MHVDRRLQRVGQLDEQVPRLRRPSELGDLNQRILRGDQHARGFAHGGGVTLRRSGHRQLRNPRRVVHDRFLQFRGDGQHHRSHRRRHRDAIRAHRRLREPLQRRRLIVVLDEAAHEQPHVLRAVRTIDHAGRVAVVSDDQDDRHAIGPGLEERHRRVEQADRAVHDDEHRLAGGLGVAVRHGDGGFLVQAGEQLGRACCCRSSAATRAAPETSSPG